MTVTVDGPDPPRVDIWCRVGWPRAARSGLRGTGAARLFELDEPAGMAP